MVQDIHFLCGVLQDKGAEMNWSRSSPRPGGGPDFSERPLLGKLVYERV